VLGPSALRSVLATVGTVAVVAGLDGVLRGASGVHDGGPASANVDSELRFFAAWYAVAGALALKAARDPAEDPLAVQACAAGFGLAAVGRVLSWRRLGAPNPLFRGLLAAEVALAAGLVPWQRRLARP
jgi:hypothetical protein